MSNKVKPENLSNKIKYYLENWVEDIEKGVADTTDTLTKEAVTELKKKSPKGKGSRSKPYYKGWQRQKNFKNHRYTIKIHNKTNYQLTHLLEFGHATRNGGYTRKFSHIRPTEERYNKLYQRKIITVIKRRSRR